MATVSLDHVSKSFGALTVLHDLSLDIADREFLVLLGPSGCGKTTTMRMIAGLDDPTTGNILIDGQRVNDRPARDRDLAMVFQNYGLYPHMTVAENIGYPLKVRGIARPLRDVQIKAAAERVELGALLARKPGELSGGQRQRVALARAIVRTPRLFLMDEPLSNLDAKLRNLMRAQLKHLQRDLATTTIYVTHDQTEAMTLADRIVIMKDGRIQQSGPPAEIYEKPANTFVAGFIGSPAMNLIGGDVSAGRFSNGSGALPVAALHDGPVVLGVRPEDIVIAEAGSGDISGTVYSSELLGDCVLLGITAGSNLINVKVGPQGGRQIGEPISITLDRQKLHAFDAASGARISLQGPIS